MAIFLTGVLRSPAGNALPNVTVRFRAVATSMVVLSGVTGEFVTDANGQYSVTLQEGSHRVEVRQGHAPPTPLGMVHIGADTTASSLNELLLASSAATPGNPLVDQILSATARAETAASNAEQSELAAGGSAQTAGESATLAGQHKLAAEQAATTATEQASIATTKASEAGSSAGAAGDSETKAQQWAEHAVDTDIPGELPGSRSSKHHATKAVGSATLAGQHQLAAEQAAQTASGSAQAAGESATLASQHNTAAGQAATTATEQASIATTKAGEASSSAGAAGDSEALAKQWAEHTPGQDIPGQPVGSKSARHWAAAAEALVDAATGGSLLKDSNLSDLLDKVAARLNLGVYSAAETDAQIAAIVNAAPGTLDTLNELAAALGNDPNFATTITAMIGTKLSVSDAELPFNRVEQPSATSYTYDGQGRITSMNTTRAGLPQTIVYTYSGDQLTTVEDTFMGKKQTTTYSYDGQGVLTGTTMVEEAVV